MRNENCVIKKQKPSPLSNHKLKHNIAILIRGSGEKTASVIMLLRIEYVVFYTQSVFKAYIVSLRLICLADRLVFDKKIFWSVNVNGQQKKGIETANESNDWQIARHSKTNSKWSCIRRTDFLRTDFE